MIGAVSCDGSQAVGYFWSKALDWPLVWDQDQETAIRSPLGGPKISWGGPPLPLEDRKEPTAFRPRSPLDGDQHAEVMADPDGHEVLCAATCGRSSSAGSTSVARTRLRQAEPPSDPVGAPRSGRAARVTVTA